MKQKRFTERGALIGEYVIVIGIVLAAVFAMGPYIAGRIQGAIAQGADDYEAVMGAGVFRPDQVQQSESTSSSEMTDVDTGTIGSQSTGTTTTTF